MCDCVNVPMGSYENQTQKILPWPEAKTYRNPIVGIDNCILEEIEYLWNKGVRTIESCCGHNIAPPFIAVDYDSINLMYYLGYWTIDRPYREGFRPNYFMSKSVSNIAHFYAIQSNIRQISHSEE